jgi:hypothetical protein
LRLSGVPARDATISASGVQILLSGRRAQVKEGGHQGMHRKHVPDVCKPAGQDCDRDEDP